MDIYSRDEWGAREPNCIDTMPTPVEYIFIHHTEGSECSSVSECGAVLRGIQNYHMDTLGTKISWLFMYQDFPVLSTQISINGILV